jgi:hypothetical protein
MRKRLLFSGIVAAFSVVAMGGAALAAGGGFGSPGTMKFRDLSAAAALTDSTGSNVFIFVDRGMQTFKLRGVAGPPVVVGPETVLSYSGYSSADGSYLSGCLVIPDSRFTVDSKLSTATLDVDPTVETPCPGFLIPAGAGGRPGISNIVPDGVGGGGGDMTITAKLTWTSNGAITSFTFNSTSRCQTAVTKTVGSVTNTFASVSGTVSVLVDVSPQYAAINQNENTIVTTGTFSPACTGV